MKRDAGNHSHTHHEVPPAAAHSHPQASARAKAAEAQHHGRHEGHRVEDFHRRFWISLALTLPILP